MTRRHGKETPFVAQTQVSFSRRSEQSPDRAIDHHTWHWTRIPRTVFISSVSRVPQIVLAVRGYNAIWAEEYTCK